MAAGRAEGRAEGHPEGAAAFRPGCVIPLPAGAAKGGRACADREPCARSGAASGSGRRDRLPGGAGTYCGLLSAGSGRTSGGKADGRGHDADEP